MTLILWMALVAVTPTLSFAQYHAKFTPPAEGISGVHVLGEIDRINDMYSYKSPPGRGAEWNEAGWVPGLRECFNSTQYTKEL